MYIIYKVLFLLYFYFYFYFFLFPLILHTSSVPRNNVQLCVLSNEDGIGEEGWLEKNVHL